MRTAPELKTIATLSPLICGVAADIPLEKYGKTGLPDAAVAALTGCGRSCRSLSRRLDWIMDEPATVDYLRIPESVDPGWLMSGGELWRTALRLGAACHRRDISLLAAQKDVAALKRTIGDDAYGFALRRAPLLLQNVELTGMGASNGSLADRIARKAGIALDCWLGRLPPWMRVRVAVRLPCSCEKHRPAGESVSEGQRKMLAGLMKQLLAGGR